MSQTIVKKNHMDIPWHDFTDAEKDEPVSKASLKEKASVIGRVGMMFLSCGTGAWRVRSSMNTMSECMGLTCTADIGLMSINYTCFDGEACFSQSLCLTNTGVNNSKLTRLENFINDFVGRCDSLTCEQVHNELDDIDDSVRAGIMTEEDIPKNITKVLGGSKSERITTLVTSLIKGGAESLHMDNEVSDAYTALHRFMFDFVYTNPKCKSEEVKAKDMIAKLYDYYVHHIEKLPAFYMNLAYQFGIDRAICDYISGMTDGFAIETFKNLFIPLGWTKY